MDNTFAVIERFQSLVKKGMFYASYANDFIFDDSVDNTIAISYLNIAVSKFSAAEAFYYSNFDILERDEAETIFAQFETFAREFLNNVRTDHSHQWTDIEYEKLKELYENSALVSKKS